MNKVVKVKPSKNVPVVTAAGQDLHILDQVTAQVKLNMVDYSTGQNKLYVIYYGVSVLRCDRYRVVLRCDRNVNVQ